MSGAARNLELAVVGNCEIAALIDDAASIVWCCLPRPDGDPVFSALLNGDETSRARGLFALDLAGRAGSEQRYVHNTAIVETVVRDVHVACVRITDFCPRFRRHGRIFRPMSLVRIARRLGRKDDSGRRRVAADAMRPRILKRAWNERRQSFVSSFGGQDLDATALLLPDLGLLPATDPRFLTTLDTIGRELREGDLLYRYRHEDGFGKPATAFTVCAFWYVNALAEAGQKEAAREQFERLLGRRTRLGLLSEDIDPHSGELWGNFPQTYSMVGIITSALRLSQRWEDAL